MLKWVTRLLFLIVVSPIVLSIFWYVISFLPHIDDIERTAKIEKKIPDTISHSLYVYAVAIETKQGIRSSFMSNTYRRLAYNPETTSHLSWQLNKVFWYLSSYLHFSDKEIFEMWISCAISGCGKGLSDAALKYFGKEITQMTKKELSGLIAITRAPSFYTSNSLRFKQRVDYVWEKVKEK